MEVGVHSRQLIQDKNSNQELRFIKLVKTKKIRYSE